MKATKRRPAGVRRAILAGAALALGAALGTVPAAVSDASPSAPAPHVMTIMMENTDYSQFAGSPQMPYLNDIAHEYADFTQAYGWTYPSLPNYLELLSGSDQGTAGNDCDITDPGCGDFTGPTLVTQLEAAGDTWNAYYQGDASGCDQSDGSGNYPYWHNPFRYFADFSSQCKFISNFSDLNANLNSNNPADFQWVVPDLVNSGGDNGTMASGDSWLNGELPAIMSSNWYRQGGQIVILYDTGYNDVGGPGGDGAGGGGQIPMVVISAHTRGMGQVSTTVDTAGVLRSIESVYGLAYLGDAANATNGSLGNALVPGRPTGSPVAETSSSGATLTTSAEGQSPQVRSVGGESLALNGVATIPAATGGPSFDAGAGDGAGTIEVGIDQGGQGVVVEGDAVQVVPGTSSLQSVSCASATTCYAVGLAPSNDDEAVLVKIVDGRVTDVTPDSAMIGLYGIACPTSTTCYAVGYDNADDADAVITVTDGQIPASAPLEVAGGGEWLNTISCASATACDAVGLVNYEPSFVPVVSGVPGSPVTIPNAWYVNGVDCVSSTTCVAVGEDTTEQGIVATDTDGVATTTVVPDSLNLYGVAASQAGSYVVTGAGLPDAQGYSSGVVLTYDNGRVGQVTTLGDTNGFGQVACGARDTGCVAVGATYFH